MIALAIIAYIITALAVALALGRWLRHIGGER